MTLESQKKDWEDLSMLDPYWAILSRPETQYGNWDIREFFLTGEREIEAVIESGGQLGHPREREKALDFGCGVGRLTLALGRYFKHCYGVDISEEMISQAHQRNAEMPNCEFIVNPADNLGIFPDNYFDLVYTNIVLQHVPDKFIIKAYISEFIRTLKAGGLLVFQLPCQIPLKNRLQPRRRAYRFLKSLGLGRRLLYERLGLHPIGMNFVAEGEILSLLNTLRATVLEVRSASRAGNSFVSNTYYVTR